MAATRPWRMFCSHGAVLFYVAGHPGCTISDIGDALKLAPKTAWRLVRDLNRSGLVQARAEGRRHRYCVEGEGSVPDPVLSHLNLRQVMSALTN